MKLARLRGHHHRAAIMLDRLILQSWTRDPSDAGAFDRLLTLRLEVESRFGDARLVGVDWVDANEAVLLW